MIIKYMDVTAWQKNVFTLLQIELLQWTVSYATMKQISNATSISIFISHLHLSCKEKTSRWWTKRCIFTLQPPSVLGFPRKSVNSRDWRSQCKSEICIPQSFLTFPTSSVNLLDPIGRIADATAAPIEGSNTDVACLSLPLAICGKINIHLRKLANTHYVNYVVSSYF